MNRRDALTTIGLTSLAGTLLTGCGQESGSQTDNSGVSGDMVPEQPADDRLVDLVYAGPDNLEEEPLNVTLMTIEGDTMVKTMLELVYPTAW